jgi:hypothetical protein
MTLQERGKESAFYKIGEGEGTWGDDDSLNQALKVQGQMTTNF